MCEFQHIHEFKDTMIKTVFTQGEPLHHALNALEVAQQRVLLHVAQPVGDGGASAARLGRHRRFETTAGSSEWRITSRTAEEIFEAELGSACH